MIQHGRRKGTNVVTDGPVLKYNDDVQMSINWLLALQAFKTHDTTLADKINEKLVMGCHTNFFFYDENCFRLCIADTLELRLLVHNLMSSYEECVFFGHRKCCHRVTLSQLMSARERV